LIIGALVFKEKVEEVQIGVCFDFGKHILPALVKESGKEVI